MDQPLDDKLVALLETESAPLSCTRIYERLPDDFDDKEELAKSLGRLVASRRLVRASRPRFGKSDELVYTVPGRNAQLPPDEMPRQPPRGLTAIAAAAKKAQPEATSASTKEPDMPSGVYKRKKRTDSTTEPGAPALKKKRKASPRKSARAPAARPASNGDARFGFFSDGSLQIDCAECQGILTQADVGALRDFTKRFEQGK